MTYTEAPPNGVGRNIFAVAPPSEPAETLREPAGWARLLGLQIMDPDGWRGPNGRNFGDKISAEEFDRRLPLCTIYTGPTFRSTLPRATELEGRAA